MRTLVALLALALSSAAAAQRPATQPIPTDALIPPATLQTMYQRELGDLYRAELGDSLLKAHELIEEYFRQPDLRDEIVAALEKLKIDPNVLGRLVRLRMHWPELKGGVYYVNERFGPHQVHYFLGVPREYDRTRSWPLVIKLPTADAFVGDSPPDADQVRDIYTGWMTEELVRHPDAIVLMPLLNLSELWGPSYRGMHSVIQPLQHAADRVNIDPARVYLFGHSMSGHAVWNLALHYPTYFASFAALAGGASADWQRLRLMNLRNVVPVVWHDTDDKVIRVDSSRRIVRLLRGLKIDVEYEETKKLGHVPPDRVVDDLYKRMRARTRELYPSHVTLHSSRRDTMFNRIDWLQVYQPLRPGEERRILFQRGSGFMLVNPTPWRLEATLKNNRIDATAQNVETLRFYLNDQMVDLGEPVTVNVNKRGRFEGLVEPSIDVMLKDQLFLGRGWRYYTAVIDIDVVAAATPSSPPPTQPATTKD